MKNYPNSVKNRDKTIDLLRVIGLLCIILAHVSPPAAIMQIRNFDVPLMVFITGISFCLSGGGTTKYLNYLIKRCKRLLLPTWAFLIFFFVLFYILGHRFEVNDYIFSFTLISGIGYVWVIRIYCLMAIITPILFKALKYLGTKKYLLFLGFMYPFYEFFVYIIANKDGFIAQIIKGFIIYAVGYGFVCGIGLAIKQMNKFQIYILMGLCCVAFIILVFFYSFSNTNIAKYPPTLYYLSYAVFMVLGLYQITQNRLFDRIKNSIAVRWISENSLWLYFWHIIPIKLLEDELILLPLNNFVIRYIFVFGSAFILTKIQIYLKTIIKRCFE